MLNEGLKVDMMGSIYEAARRIFIRLGDEGPIRVGDFLEWIGRAAPEMREYQDLSKSLENLSPNVKEQLSKLNL